MEILDGGGAEPAQQRSGPDPAGVVLLVTPPPTPNGPLHLGHLFGPYVAGDVAARAARARGLHVVTQCGLDANQNYVLAKAQSLGESGPALASRYSSLIRQAFTAARIDHDILVDPLTDADYRDSVVRLFGEAIESKAIEVAAVRLAECRDCGRVLHHARVAGTCPGCGSAAAGGTCEGCGRFLTAVDLTDASTTCCRASPRPVERAVPVLRLEEHRDALCRLWSRAELPPRERRLIGRYLDEGLPEVPLAYPTDWGLEWRRYGEPLRIDVWAEMAVANLYLPARHLRPGTRTIADCLQAWCQIREQWLFMGLDNAFYYAIMIPALHLALGLTERPTTYVVNEFYRLDGAKFSTSRNHAIWAHEFLAAEEAGVVRAFGCWDRPDHGEANFTSAGYTAFKRLYLHARDLTSVAKDAGESPDRLPDELADAELARGEHALQPDRFDPAMAVRAAMATAAARSTRAQRLFDVIGGTD